MDLGLNQAQLFDEMERLAQLGHWEWDEVTNTCLYCSNELARLHGVTPEVYLRRTSVPDGDLDWVHPDDHDHVLACHRRFRESKEPYQIEYRINQTDGDCIKVREVVEPVFDETGVMVRSEGYMQALATSSPAPEEVLKSTSLLAQAMAMANLGVWVWNDLHDECVYCSAELAALFGGTVEDYMKIRGGPDNVDAGIHPDDRQHYMDVTTKASDQGQAYEVEFREQINDGSYRYFREVGRPLQNRSEATLLTYGIVQDITDAKNREIEVQSYRKALEQKIEEQTAQLTESERRYLSIFETMTAGIGQTALSDGRVILANRKLAQIFGYDDVNEFIREFVFSEHYVNIEDRERVLDNYQRTPGEATECAWYRRDGQPVIVQAHATMNEAEGVLDFVAIDVTELRQSEMQLQQAQKMEAIGQLTGGIAHDFNNLLSAIIGNVDLLEDRLGDDNRPLQAILRAATRGADLTQRLLTFSRRQALSPRAIDLARSIDQFRDLLVPTLGAAITFELETAPDLWPAWADPNQVDNALLNLAINARDAMQEGGKVVIRCTNVLVDSSFAQQTPDASRGHYVKIEVQDTGTGMTSETMAHVFEPFFTTKESDQGSGLGLSMVYGFAQQSGGFVTIESELGKGTSVNLYLPRAEQQAIRAREDQQGLPTPSGKNEKILVIEDDPDVGPLVLAMVTKMGYRVSLAASAQEALDLLSTEGSPDLVISDVMLPGDLNGPDLARKIGQDWPKARFIFMTGYARDIEDQAFLLGEKAPVLSKPFRRETLAEAIRNQLSA